MPSSVACCTAYSSRSPFASACASQIAGLAGGVLRTSSTSTTNSAASAVTIMPDATKPEPLPIAMRSPAVTRLTVTACRASGPVTEIRAPGSTGCWSSLR